MVNIALFRGFNVLVFSVNSRSDTNGYILVSRFIKPLNLLVVTE